MSRLRAWEARRASRPGDDKWSPRPEEKEAPKAGKLELDHDTGLPYCTADWNGEKEDGDSDLMLSKGAEKKIEIKKMRNRAKI